MNLEDFADQITQKVGEPLDAPRVTESLKKLYATGRFLELRADVETKDDGVELIFVGQAVFFSGPVRVEGAPKSIDPKVLTDASRLRLGQALSGNELDEASRRLTAVLANNAYYQARVKQRLIRNPDTQEADVVFSIVSGPQAQLSRVEFEGNTAVPPQSLTGVAGLRPGHHLTSASLERALFKIHKFYVAGGRLQSTAVVQKRVYDPESRTEILRVHVEAGPLVRVRVKGASVSNSQLRDLLPMFKDGVVDEEALARGEKILEDYFQRRGYISASAKADRVDRSGSKEIKEIDITYQVTLGTPEEFAGYSFRGNRSVPTAELSAALGEQQNGSSPTRKNVFSQELLRRSLDAVQAVYRSRGYLEARVTPRLQQQPKSQPSSLLVTLEIEEGPRTKVGHLTLRGVDQKAEYSFWPLLLTKPGEPYSPERAQADRDRILAYYAEQGYTRASATWQASPISADHETDLEYRVELGPQERIKRVVVMGYQNTRLGLIRRQLSLREGEPLRQSALLESQRRLYDLGVFNQVQITKQDTQGSETDQTILVSVEEARRWTVGYGGGLELQRLGSNNPEGQLKASPRLSLELSRLNVGGRAQTFVLSGRISNLENSGGLTYLVPHLLTHHDLTLRLNGLVDRSRDVLTFTSRRREAGVSLEKRYSPTTALVGRFSFRRVEASDLRIRPEFVPLLSRSARIAMLDGSFVNDHRDNPADATHGSYSLAGAGVSWDKLGSEANFLRFAGQNATYYRLNPHLIFARSLRFQVESPFGKNPQSIPLPERFFMGGSESHRGFSINQAGPRDTETGFPIGGNALFLNSLELRIPLEEKRFGFVVFHDAGNVYSSLRRMRLLKVSQGAPTDFDYTVHAVGFGTRYKTLVGPVRLDVAYGLNPTRFPVNASQGTPAPPRVEVRQLSRFQFFLSIGQSF